jgi:hypothetical protein
VAVAGKPQLRVCTRCQRANPAEASYCHADGTPLVQTPGQPRAAHGQMPHEFVFPSGKTCRTYDQLVQACQEEWADARNLLQQGVFAQFLAAAGRLDLVQMAQKAQANPDPDVALHTFIGGLPASRTEGPRLDIRPRRVVLGSMRVGETRFVKLVVANLGKGLLHGTLTVAAGNDWLQVENTGVSANSQGGAPRNGQCTLKTALEQQITLRIDTRNLVAKQNYAGKLTVITNGGIVEVPVALTLAAMPFHRPPFQGASSPREMAERMRAQPKPAAPLLESGEVARWFTANGWVYPVPVTAAKGVAAVQQFFEGMGLSKPPPLQLSETEMRFICYPPEVPQGEVILQTAAKKWVYGSADSDVPWLKVLTPTVSGPQQAPVRFEIDSTLMDPGRIQEGTIRMVANGGQRLSVRVFVDVRKPQVPFTRRWLRPFFAGALLALLYRLLLAGPADVYARVLAGGPGAGGFESWLQSPLLRGDAAAPFPPYVRHFVLATWWLGALAGAVLLWQKGSRWADVFCGTVAGAVAGLLGSATFACVLPALDSLPRAIWQVLGRVLPVASMPAWPVFWTLLWIALTVACWTLAGGLAGLLLRLLGERGLALLSGVGRPFSWLARGIGLHGVAAFFALS